MSSGTVPPPFSCCQTRSVAQKKDIKRQKERLEALKKEAEQEKVKAKEAARERVLADFEKGQLGLTAADAAAVTTSGAEVTGNESRFLNSFFSFCDRLSYDLLSSRPRDQAQIRVRFHSHGKARTGS